MNADLEDRGKVVGFDIDRASAVVGLSFLGSHSAPGKSVRDRVV